MNRLPSKGFRTGACWSDGKSGLGRIERTGSTCARSLMNVEVDHGGFEAGMSEKVL